jgi:hypothetical protein
MRACDLLYDVQSGFVEQEAAADHDFAVPSPLNEERGRGEE